MRIQILYWHLYIIYKLGYLPRVAGLSVWCV